MNLRRTTLSRCVLIASAFLGLSVISSTPLLGLVSAAQPNRAASFEALKPTSAPLDVARLMAEHYPMSPTMSYIPALAWSGALRLSALSKESRWAEKAKAEMQPFLSDERPASASQTSLGSLAGHIAFADFALSIGDKRAAESARAAADLILPQDPNAIVRFGVGWTDDMYMAAAQLARVAALTKENRYSAAATTVLLSYASKLQRPDGLFIHAVNAPYTWGRGNGFASLGMADALQFLPANAPDRPRLVEIYRTHLKALLKHQSDDGMWHQLIDEPTSYRELTSTALLLSTMARGVRLGWLDTSFIPAIGRAWAGILARVGTDGSLRDVCSSTSAGPTKEHYLNRPITNGPDDRAGAMVLLAALEFEELRRSR